MVTTLRTTVKRVLSKSSIADYCVNPYIGCEHGCLYCYARYYTSKFYRSNKEWGEYVVIKENAPEVLRKELVKRNKGTIYFSSLTDPYQPIEKKEKITRRCLEIVKSLRWPPIIQTKSSIVLRDLEFISEIEESILGVTIISLRKDISKVFEPKASSPDERLKILEEANEVGIHTYAFLGPILPFTEISEVLELIESVKDFSDLIYVDKFNYKPGLSKALYPVIGEEIKEWIKASEMKSEYYKVLKERISKKGIRVLY